MTPSEHTARLNQRALTVGARRFICSCVKKAKELVVDLLESEKPLRPVTIHNEEVEMRRPSSMGDAYQQQPGQTAEQLHKRRLEFHS